MILKNLYKKTHGHKKRKRKKKTHVYQKGK